MTQRFIYAQLIHQKSTDHGHQAKWILERDDLGAVSWDGVWESVHVQFFTERIKSTIWEQVHLGFYTTYNYNVWHNTLLPCPLCHKIPQDVFHVLLDCGFTVGAWAKIEHILMGILPIPLSTHERAFGLQPRCKGEKNATILRNWITFSLRHHIMKEERRAYYLSSYSSGQERIFFQVFNRSMQRELIEKQLQYRFGGLEQKFDNILSASNVMLRNNDDEYIWTDV